MTRVDDDSWDLASSVGATATMVAAARALASAEDDPLIDDPYAAPLVRAVGVEFFTKLIDGQIPDIDSDTDTDTDGDSAENSARLLTTVMAVRTRWFDDFFVTATGGGHSADATRSGIRQAVILASGLDARPYRLPWPDGTVVYEIDQPRVIEFKSATMADIGATPTALRRTVAVDLRDDWPAALRAAGFDTDAPTAWSAEGLLVYLPPEAQDRLFDNITALSAPGSRLATEFHPDAGAGISARAAEMNKRWGRHGFDVNLDDLFYKGERTPVVDYLTDHGWHVEARTRAEVFGDYGRVFPDSDVLAPMRNSTSIIAERR
jgi:methyltransferase (TIGR00027 family)